MNRDRLKRKYLRRAQHLLHTKSEKTPKCKLQASVEPFVHSDQKLLQPFQRSTSDPTKSTNHSNTGYNHHNDQCTSTHSEPHSLNTPQSKGTGYKSPSVSHQHLQNHSDNDLHSVRFHQHTGRPCPSLTGGGDGDLPQTTATSPHLLLVSPSDRSYKHLGTTSESSKFFDALLLHPRDGAIVSGVYPVSSTPIASSIRGYSPSEEAEASELSEAQKCVSELDSKLKVQMNVNRELKRLLVASVGSDLQLRLDQIVQEKATLSHELDTSLQHLAENNEDIDRVSIECDIWRSKFLASRLMIDELASWKAELSLQFKESQRALQCLLKEHDELKKTLAVCNARLQQTSVIMSSNMETLNSRGHTRSEALTTEHQYLSPHSTVLDLANVAVNLAKDVHDQSQYLGHMVPGLDHMISTTPPAHTPSKDDTPSLSVEPTVGEKLAKHVLMSRQQFLKSQNRTFPLPLQLDDSNLTHQRSSHRAPGLSGSSLLYTLNRPAENASDIPSYCKCCKGKLICL